MPDQSSPDTKNTAPEWGSVLVYVIVLVVITGGIEVATLMIKGFLPFWSTMAVPLVQRLWQWAVGSLQGPIEHLVVVVSVIVLGIVLFYWLLAFVTWLLHNRFGVREGKVLYWLGIISATVLVATIVVPVVWIMGPVLLHDASSAIAMASPYTYILQDWRDNFSSYYWIPILLLFVIALSYIYAPRADRFYREVVLPRRTVWLTFTIVIISTLWLTIALGIDLKNRAGTAQPLLAHAANAAQRLSDINDKGPWPSRDALYSVKQLVRDMDELSKRAAIESPTEVITGSVQSQNILRIGVDNITVLTAQLADGVRREMGVWTVGAVETQAHSAALVKSIATALTDLQNVSALPYFTVAVLYSIFLLLPWVIYIVYISARRGNVTSQAVADLTRFDILKEVCEKLTSDSEDVQRAKEWRSAFLAGDEKKETAKQEIKKWRMSARRVFTVDTYNAIVAPEEPSKLNEKVKHDTEQFIVGRAQFYSLEYLIPLGLLSIVSAVGWYYTFLAGTLTNLYEFIRQGGSSPLLSALLMNNVTAFTAAFLGGWIFVIIMLLNCWTRDDLYPRTYFHAAAHLMIAMIVGFAFAAALGHSKEGALTISVTLAALVISLVPYDSVGLLTQKWLAYLGEHIKPKPNEPDGTAASAEAASNVWILHELQQLPGATLWDETRLHQEGIDSAGDLAGAKLERLVLQTQYSGHRIAQWVDTALLRTHVSTTALAELTKLNVLTATDLFLACISQGEMEKLLQQIRDGQASKTSVGEVVLKFIQQLPIVEAKLPTLASKDKDEQVPKQAPDDAEKKNSTLAVNYRTVLSTLALEHNLKLVLNYRFETAPASADAQ